MLRLDPRHPPLWRSETSLQFGVDAVVVLDDLAPWEERMIAVLAGGIPTAAYDACARAFGADRSAALRLRRALEPVLGGRDEPPPPAVRVELPHDFPGDLADAIVDAFAETGAAAELAPWWELPARAVDAGPPVVAVGAYLLDPRRVTRFMRDDIAHLPLLLGSDRVHVGPVVHPGRTACLSCLHAHRRDTDPAWPAVAAQALALPVPATPRSILYDAAVIARRLVSARPGRASRSATIHARHARPTWHAHLPHADCLCRSPARSATPLAPVVPFPAPTTARGSARRA